jgi:hypothetical protein
MSFFLSLFACLTPGYMTKNRINLDFQASGILQLLYADDKKSLISATLYGDKLCA